MILRRRQALAMGGAFAAALAIPSVIRGTEGAHEIEMIGSRNGARVWFNPIGLHIEPGQTITWVNRDAGNSHTATAYHPANFNHPRRMPEAAQPWNSGYLLPEKTFSVTLTRRGVYDYFCIPHEAAGMVGRIVVGEPGSHDWTRANGAEARLPNLALNAFPPVEEIMKRSIIRP